MGSPSKRTGPPLKKGNTSFTPVKFIYYVRMFKTMKLKLNPPGAGSDRRISAFQTLPSFISVPCGPHTIWFLHSVSHLLPGQCRSTPAPHTSNWQLQWPWLGPPHTVASHGQRCNDAPSFRPFYTGWRTFPFSGRPGCAPHAGGTFGKGGGGQMTSTSTL